MMNHPGVSRFSPELLRAAALWRPPFQMERLASNVLDEGGIDFACDLVDSRWPHLGILVARGLLPMVTSFDRQTLLNSIGEARDRPDLPAIDPVEDTVEAWLGDELESDRWLGRNLGRRPLRALDPDDGGDGDDSWASGESEPDGRDGVEAAPQRVDAEHWQALEEKEGEVRHLRDQLSEVRGLLQEQDSESSGGTVESGPEADPRFVELRERVHRLKGELTQRHAERNQLRRQLDRMRKRVDALTAQQEEPPVPPGLEVSGAPTELPEELAGSLPPRLPRYAEHAASMPIETFIASGSAGTTGSCSGFTKTSSRWSISFRDRIWSGPSESFGSVTSEG